MLRLREQECTHAGFVVREAVRYAADSMWFTDQLENGDNVLRRRESHHSAGVVGATEEMHQLRCSSVLNDFGRNQIAVTNGDMLMAPRQLPKTTFKFDPKRSHSLGAKFDRLSLAANTDWHSTDYAGRSAGTFALRSLVEASEGFNTLLKSWKSLLAVPKSIIYHTSAECDRWNINGL